MSLRISELFGYLIGFPVGIILAAGSILRNARIFHPRGLVFCGDVEMLPESPIQLGPHALIRFSGGWWKHREWPDVLGLSLRTSHQKITSPRPGKDDRDLLFASFRRPWELFFAPFFTDYHDYLLNSYYAVSPFLLFDGRKIDLMVDPVRGRRSRGSREENLTGEVISGKVVLRLMMKETSRESWKMIGRIHVREESHVDQEALRFHPFNSGPQMRPFGFIQHMRKGAYPLSQWVRPGSEVTGEELPTEKAETHSR